MFALYRSLLRFEQHIAKPLNIFFAGSYRLIHIRHGFVAQTDSHLGDVTFGIVDLPVLELTIDDLLSLRRLFVFDLLERLTNLILRLGGRHEIQPIRIGMLVRRSKDRYLIAVLQFLTDRDILVSDRTAHTMGTHIAVDRIGEIEHGSSFRQTFQVTRRGKDIHVSATLMNDLPFDTFVCPMGCYTLLRHLVHTFGTDLHFYPSFLGSQDRGMKRLVSVLLRDRQPIAQTFGVRREDISDERIDLPAVGFLLLRRRVQDDTNSKEVVNFIHVAMLSLHLMVDRVNRFRTPFDGKDKPFFFQFLFKRRDERSDIRLAFGFLGVQRVRDILVGVIIEKLQRKVFHLGFDLI